MSVANKKSHDALYRTQTLVWNVTVLSPNHSALLVGGVRVHELEEQLKDQEARAEHNMEEEVRRHREAFSKMERDKNTHLELLNNR